MNETEQTPQQTNSTTQYNFKINTQFKEQLDEALATSNAQNKTEFLSQMLQAYQIQSSNIQTDIDFSSLDSLDTHTKEAVSKAFQFIIKTIEQNTSQVKQEHIQLDIQKKELEEKANIQVAEIEKMKLDYLENKNTIQKTHEEAIKKLNEKVTELNEIIININLEKVSLKNELKNTSKIASQVESVINESKIIRVENKGLKDDLKLLQTEMKEELEKEKKIFTLRVKELEKEMKDINISHNKKVKEIEDKSRTKEEKNKNEYQNNLLELKEQKLALEFEVKNKSENIDRVEKVNNQLESKINTLSKVHTVQIEAEKKIYNKELNVIREELNLANKELHIAQGQLSIIEKMKLEDKELKEKEKKETQKVTSTKKEEKSLFDNEKKK